MPDTSLLPRHPTSIASVVSLLADGKLLQFLPKNAQYLNDPELEQSFGPGAVFHLGWWTKKNEEECEESDPETSEAQAANATKRFGIYAIKEDNV